MESEVATQLLYTVLQKNTESATALLSQGAKSGRIDPYFGTSPLLAACHLSVNLVPKLVTQENANAVNGCDRTGQTPLMIIIQKLHVRMEHLRCTKAQRSGGAGVVLCQGGRIYLQPDDQEACKLEDALAALRQNGADMNLRRVRIVKKETFPRDPQTIVRTSSIVECPISRKDFEFASVETDESAYSLAKALLETYVNVWDVCAGLAKHDLAAAMEIYKQYGIELNLSSTDAMLRSTLHYAADNGQTVTLKRLLELKACDVEAVDFKGHTALHCAAAKGHLEATSLLLAHAPQLALASDSQGRSALHLWPFARTATDYNVWEGTLRSLAGASRLAWDALGLTQLHVCAASGGSKEAVLILASSLQECDVCAVEEVEQKKVGFMPAPQKTKGWTHLVAWHKRREEDNARRKKRWESKAKANGWLGWKREVCSPKALHSARGERYGGRSVWELALVSKNEPALAALSELSGGRFPVPAGNGSEALRLAMVTCSHATVAPEGSLITAWKEVKERGEKWPSTLSEKLVATLKSQGDLGVVLGGCGVLSAAVLQGEKEVVKMLLEDGVNPNGQDTESIRPVEHAVVGGDGEMVKMLMGAGATTTRQFGVDGRCHWCGTECRNKWSVAECVQGRIGAAIALADKIKSPGVETNVGSVAGADAMSLLGLATLLKKIDAVEALVSTDVVAGYTTGEGHSTSVLHMMLAAAEAEGCQKKKERARWEKVGEIMMMMMMMEGVGDEGKPGRSTLELALRGGWRDISARLVAESEELVAGGEPALVVAVSHGELDLVKALFQRGVRVPCGEGGQSLVEMALAHGHSLVAAALCEHAAGESEVLDIAREVLMVKAAAREVKSIRAATISGVTNKTRKVWRAKAEKMDLNDADEQLGLCSRANVKLSLDQLALLMASEKRVRKLLATQRNSAMLRPLLQLVKQCCDDDAVRSRYAMSSCCWPLHWPPHSLIGTVKYQHHGLELPCLLGDAINPERLLAQEFLHDAVVAVVAATTWLSSSLSSNSNTSFTNADFCVKTTLEMANSINGEKEEKRLEGALPLLFAAVTGNAKLTSNSITSIGGDLMIPIQRCEDVENSGRLSARWLAEGLYLELVDTCSPCARHGEWWVDRLKMTEISLLGCAILHDCQAVLNDNGNIKVVDALMDASTRIPLVGYKTCDGTTVSALHMLMEVGEAWDRRTLPKFLQWERSGVMMVEAGSTDEGKPGKSTLELAVRGGWSAVAAELVAGGQELVAGGEAALLEMVRHGKPDLLLALLQRLTTGSLSCSKWSERVGWSVVEAARRRQCKEVAEILAESQNLGKAMALRVLADCACEEAFCELYASIPPGPNLKGLVGSGGEDGRTLLMCAIQGGSEGIVQRLLADDCPEVWADAVLMRGPWPFDLAPNTNGETDAEEFCKEEMHREAAVAAVGEGSREIRRAARVVPALEFAVVHSREEELALAVLAKWGTSDAPALTNTEVRNLGGLGAVRGMGRLLHELVKANEVKMEKASNRARRTPWAGSSLPNAWGTLSWSELAAVSRNASCWVLAAHADAAAEPAKETKFKLGEKATAFLSKNVTVQALECQVYKQLLAPMQTDSSEQLGRRTERARSGERQLLLGGVEVDDDTVKALVDAVAVVQRGDEHCWEWAMSARHAGVIKVLSNRLLAALRPATESETRSLAVARGLGNALDVVDKLVGKKLDDAAAYILQQVAQEASRRAFEAAVVRDADVLSMMKEATREKLRALMLAALAKGCKKTALVLIEDGSLSKMAELSDFAERSERSLEGGQPGSSVAGHMGVHCKGTVLEMIFLAMTHGHRAWGEAWIKSGFRMHQRLEGVLNEWAKGPSDASGNFKAVSVRQNDLNYMLSGLGLSDFQGNGTWVETTDSNGKTYWFNSLTMQTTWSHPPQLGVLREDSTSDGEWVDVAGEMSSDSEAGECERQMDYETEYSKSYK